MLCASTDSTANSIASSLIPSLSNGTEGEPSMIRSDAQVYTKTKTKTEYVISPEVFVYLELSLVPDIERVFVDRDPDARELRVIEVVDKRDADVRKKLYEREQAIIDAHPHLNFDFHIIARMGRDLNQVLQDVGKTRG